VHDYVNCYVGWPQCDSCYFHQTFVVNPSTVSAARFLPTSFSKPTLAIYLEPTVSHIMVDLGFSRLVRYENGGKVLFGDLQSHENGKYRVKRLDGDLDEGFHITNDEHTVERVRFDCPSLSDIRLTWVSAALPATK
jgi:hypothetical protein